MAIWFTVRQVAKYLQISTTTVYSLAKRGDMPASWVGDQWRFEKLEIDKWLRQRSRATKTKRGKKEKA